MDTTARLAELRRTFAVPQKLQYPGPRPVRLTTAGRVLVTVSVLLFAGAAVAGIMLEREARRQAANREAIVARGMTVAGEVIRLWPRGEHRRRVRYRFEAEGGVHEAQMNVSSETRRSLEVGSPIAVRYLPGNPDVNDLGGTPRVRLPEWLPPLIAMVLAAVGALCLVALNRQRRLLTEGRAAPAVVTGHKKHHTSHGGSYGTMTFEFALLSGSVRRGKSNTSSKPPAIGSVVCVVYDPDQPSRHGVFPFCLVSPA